MATSGAEQAEHTHHAPAQARMLVNPLDLREADVDAGAAAFAGSCAGCHGDAGKGGAPVRDGGPPASDLTSADYRSHADGELYWVVTEGIAASGMPAFKASLDEATRWQLVAYLRRLGGARLTLSSGDTPGYVWDLPRGYPRPKVPADNPMSVAKAELGRHLFYDTRLSMNGTYSCASCHEQARAFSDARARAIGATGEVHPRSSMSLANIAYSPVLTWANPTQRRLETQALVPMFGEEPVELGLSGQEGPMLARLRAEPRYGPLFTQAFPGETDPLTLGNVTRAIASFERTLLSGRSPYDRYRLGEDPTAISEAAKRGETLFFSERTECFHCHGGFNFTETSDFVGKGFVEVEFHNTGLYNVDGEGAYPAPNTGVMSVTEDPADMGRFKAPTLRNVAVTAPYMHDGSAATLADVLEHYSSGGRTIPDGPNRGIGANSPLKSTFVKRIDLTPKERADLIAFLESLTDEGFLRDARFGDPWK
ncbi:MAG: MbnH family di-heme enzyme [Vicinamibacterales bacterium]